MEGSTIAIKSCGIVFWFGILRSILSWSCEFHALLVEGEEIVPGVGIIIDCSGPLVKTSYSWSLVNHEVSRRARVYQVSISTCKIQVSDGDHHLPSPKAFASGISSSLVLRGRIWCSIEPPVHTSRKHLISTCGDELVKDPDLYQHEMGMDGEERVPGRI